MPSRARDEAEAVARGFRRADAPTRCRRARFQILRRPEQKQRQAGIGGGELQPLARSQIELIDDAGDGGRRARMQRLLDRPQSVFAARGLDQNDARRVETERAQSVAMKAAVGAERISGQDEDERMRRSPPFRVRRGETGHDRRDKAESGRHSVRRGHDLVQRAAGEAASRQAGIKGGKTKRQRLAPIRDPRQQATQLLQHNGAIVHRGKAGAGNKLWHCCWHRCAKGGLVFAICSRKPMLEQTKNIAKPVVETRREAEKSKINQWAGRNAGFAALSLAGQSV